MQTKTADSKGRVTLGDKFANRTVIIEEVDDTEVRVTIARVVPEREAWLYETPEALAALKRGMAQAKRRRFAHPPDLKAAQKRADADRDK